jgi:hypothetical protein
MSRIIKNFYAGLLLLVVATPSPVWAFAFNINVNTASLVGTDAILAFDFYGDDGAVNNTVKVSNFLTGGSFDPNQASSQGDVSGLLNSTVLLGDNSSFAPNELLQPITLGTSLQFLLETTNTFAAGATVPDSFSFFILDSNLLPLVTTNDPIPGANALFALDLTGAGSGDLLVFASTSTEPTWSVVPVETVPEPGCLELMLIGGWSVYLRKKRKNRT